MNFPELVDQHSSPVLHRIVVPEGIQTVRRFHAFGDDAWPKAFALADDGPGNHRIVRVSLLVAELSSCKAQILAPRHLANSTSVLDLREVQEPTEQAPMDKNANGQDFE